MRNTYVITSNGELYHHGVKGMKWGVRRYQNTDGSLTPAGKRRYYDTPELNKQKSELESLKARKAESAKAYNNAASTYNMLPTRNNKVIALKARERYQTNDKAYRRAKLQYDADKEAARIREKGIEFEKKSKHRLKLEEQYKGLGMTDEQAQAAANKRIRTEKILAASAAMTVAACATYIAVKERKRRIDGVIKAGEMLQRIEMTDTEGKLYDVFYASKGDHDNKRYLNLLGATRQKQTGEAFVMKLGANSDMKIASQDKAVKTFKDLYNNDSEFKDSIRLWVGSNKETLNDRQARGLYERFNAGLVRLNKMGTGADTKFYNALKKAGYGAVQDINDMKFSGYAAKNPLIVFDNSNSNIMVQSVSKITENLGKKGNVELGKALGEHSVQKFMTKYGPLSAAALAGKAAVSYVSDPRKEFQDNTNKK